MIPRIVSQIKRLVFFEVEVSGRVITQTKTVSEMDAVGNQKSKLRIGESDCIQYMAIKLQKNIPQTRYLFGTNHAIIKTTRENNTM